MAGVAATFVSSSFGTFGGGDKGGCTGRANTEIADTEVLGCCCIEQPLGETHEALVEDIDVETEEMGFIVYFFFCSTLLGSAAALVLDSLGGTNISPSHLQLGFLTCKLVHDERVARGIAREVSVGRPGFWLLLTVVYSIIGAFYLPRLLAGQTMTYAVRAQGAFVIPLAPAMSNLTQSIYFTADFVCFIVLSGYASTTDGRKVLGGAALACATLNLVFAALDLMTYFTNTTELFSFIRNANYALLNDTEVAGLKRIVGSFTEASSFGAATARWSPTSRGRSSAARGPDRASRSRSRLR